MKNYMMLACLTLKREITAVMEENDLHYPRVLCSGGTAPDAGKTEGVAL